MESPTHTSIFGERFELPGGYDQFWRDYQRRFQTDAAQDAERFLTPAEKRDFFPLISTLFPDIGILVSGNRSRIQLTLPQHAVVFSPRKGRDTLPHICLSPEVITELGETYAVRYRRNRLLGGYTQGEVTPGPARDFLDTFFSFYELHAVRGNGLSSILFRADRHELCTLPISYLSERHLLSFYDNLPQATKDSFFRLV